MRKRFDFLEKDVLAVDLSEELIINTNCIIQLTYTHVPRRRIFLFRNMYEIEYRYYKSSRSSFIISRQI